MNVKKVLAGVAAMSLVAAPAVAQSAMAPALAPLSGDESALSGSGALLGALAVAAVVGGIIIIADDNDNEIPVSG